MPTPDGGYTILELNGAVDFTHEYRSAGDIYRETVEQLCRFAHESQVADSEASTDPVPV